MQESTLQIYNASAGSGKTYSLVREYLEILLSNPSNFTFGQVLCITFTNKAAAEMKTRIIERIKEFSSEEILQNPTPLFEEIHKNINLSPKQIQQKSKTILAYLLHNYHDFWISTIDKFNHRVVRTFSRDLGLDAQFEVSLNTSELLNEAINQLIQNIKNDKELREVLISFSLQKVENENDWRVNQNLAELGSLLFNEEDYFELSETPELNLKQIIHIKKGLRKRISDFEKRITQIALSAVQVIEKNISEPTKIYRAKQGIYNYFLKFQKNFDAKNLFPNSYAMETLEEDKWYSKTCPKPVQFEIETIKEEIQNHYFQIKTEAENNFYSYCLNIHLLKTLTSFSLIGRMAKQMKKIQDKENIVSIHNFNQLIFQTIKDDPAPYIYERLGNKYRYFFIDEFQDTSTLQFENLWGLIENTLSYENGGCWLLGDPKQSIYRWRGGNADLMIDLIQSEEGRYPFKKEVLQLDSNYRSYSNIVSFSNEFFDFISPKINKQEYKNIYTEIHKQKVIKQKEGKVSISFSPKSKEKFGDEIQTNLLNVIHEVLEKKGNYSDVCILVRNNIEGVLVADFFTENNIPIMSSETLLVKNSSNVQFLMLLLQSFYEPFQDKFKVQIINFLIQKNPNENFDLSQKINYHFEIVGTNLKDWCSWLNKKSYEIDFEIALQLPIYELMHYFSVVFQLDPTEDVFLQFFLDWCYEYEQRFPNEKSMFIKYWEKEKESLSIATSSTLDAVKIMTIHKSKGLEFPVVVLPFVNFFAPKIHKEHYWEDLSKDGNYQGIGNYPVTPSSMFSLVEPPIEALRSIEDKQIFDNINLFYVAVTRAKIGLYLLAEESTKNDFSNFLEDFINSSNDLEWKQEDEVFSIGNYFFEKNETIIDQNSTTNILKNKAKKWIGNLNLHTTSETNFKETVQESIDEGNIIHDLMSFIETKDDMSYALSKMYKNGRLDLDQMKKYESIISKIIEHPEIERVFSNPIKVLAEHDLIGEQKEVFRLDRLTLTEDGWVLLDYKTGDKQNSHKKQLKNYASILKENKIEVVKKGLVYIHEEISVEWVF